MTAWLVHASLLILCLSFGIFTMFRLQWAFRAWLPFEALFAYDIVSLKVATPLPFIPPLHYLSPPYQPPTDWMAYIPPYLLIWPMENTFSGLLTDYILVIVGVALGIIGIDRGWGRRSWIPLGVFSLNVTILIVLGAFNRPDMAMDYIKLWLILVIPQLLAVVPGIIGIDRGWGYKAWIPLGIFLLVLTALFITRISFLMGSIEIWLILVILELLGVVPGIIGMNRGWGHKAWIPLAVLSVPIGLLFWWAILYVPG